MFAKPKEGLKVFDPALRDFLPAEGREVGPLDGHGFYWQRRLNDGDIESLDETAAAKSLAAAETERKAEAAKAAADKAAADKAAQPTGAPAPKAEG